MLPIFRTLVLFLGILLSGFYEFLWLIRIKNQVFSINRTLWLVFCIMSQYIRILFEVSFLSFHSYTLLSTIFVIFTLFNASPKDNADEVPFSIILLSHFKSAMVPFNLVIYFSFILCPVAAGFIYSQCYRDVRHLCILKWGEGSRCLWCVVLTFGSIFTFYISFPLYFVL